MDSNDQPQPPRVLIEITRGRARIRRRPVRPPVFLIGRATDCDLVLGDPSFPELHTYLFVTSDGVSARHVGIGSPLLINGVDVENCELRHHDTMTMGAFEFRIHIHHPSLRHKPSDRNNSGHSASGRIRTSKLAGSNLAPATIAEAQADIVAVSKQEVEILQQPLLRVYNGPEQLVDHDLELAIKANLKQSSRIRQA